MNRLIIKNETGKSFKNVLDSIKQLIQRIEYPNCIYENIENEIGEELTLFYQDIKESINIKVF